MWYSWSGASQSDESQNPPTEAVDPSSPAAAKGASWVPTILDPRISGDLQSITDAVHLPKNLTYIFWRTFLKNVDPLVKIFFRWEVEPIIQKAHEDVSSLSSEERALVSAIVFISISSLPGDECSQLLHDGKPQLMDRYRKSVESALILADYTSTTNKLTLQAFILYLVRFFAT